MSHEHDGSSIDLERALDRYMREHHLSRRRLLERIAAIGATAALAPIIAACSTPAGSAAPAPSQSAAGASAGAPSTGPSEAPASAEPTPVPSPEAELFIYNWTEYIGENTIPSFEDN
jgi:spermidine/putrescine-binding protein